MSTPLPCGCIRGSYLCPEAVRLWDKRTVAYREAEALHTPSAWEAYQQADEAYDDHFNNPKEE